MKYEMKNTTDTVEERIASILEGAADSQFIKYMPKEPVPEPVKQFLVSEITALIVDCADVVSNGGYEKVAATHGVKKNLVKAIEKAIQDEWNRRVAANTEVV